jgi:hypothetical protein
MNDFQQSVRSLYQDCVHKVFNPDHYAVQNPKGTEMNDRPDLKSHGEKAWNTGRTKRKKTTVISN